MLSTKQAQIFRSYNNQAKALGFAHVRYAGALAVECMNAIKAVEVVLPPHAAAKAARVVKPQMTKAERVLAAHKARTVSVVLTEAEVQVVKPVSAMTVAEASVVATTKAKKAAKAKSKAARKAAREQAKANSKAAKAKRAAVKAEMVEVKDEVKVEVHPVQELLNVAEAALAAYEAAPSRKTKTAAAIAITNAERAMTPKAEVKTEVAEVAEVKAEVAEVKAEVKAEVAEVAEVKAEGKETVTSLTYKINKMAEELDTIRFSEGRAIDACQELTEKLKKADKANKVLRTKLDVSKESVSNLTLEVDICEQKLEESRQEAADLDYALGCYKRALESIDPEMARRVEANIESDLNSSDDENELTVDA